MSRVLVAAWIGSTNLGDELVFAGLRRLLAQRGADVAAVSVNPEATWRMHGVRATRDRGVWAALRGADALVLGGGGLLQDATSPFNVPYHLSRPLLAELRGVPWAGIGLGAGPLREATAHRAKGVLRRSVALTVRHESAARVLSQCGVNAVTAADLAFALPPRTVAPDDVVTVSLRPWAGHYGSRLPVAGGRLARSTPDWFVKEIAAALDAIGTATGLTIRFVALQSDRDGPFHRRVGERLHVAHEHVMPSLHNVVETIGRGRVVVAMRYHGAVAAVLAGRPVVTVSYSLKTDRLTDDLGLAAARVPWRAGALSELPIAVDKALGDIAGSAEAAQTAADRLARRGARNGEALDRLLEAAARRTGDRGPR